MLVGTGFLTAACASSRAARWLQASSVFHNIGALMNNYSGVLGVYHTMVIIQEPQTV